MRRTFLQGFFTAGIAIAAMMILQYGWDFRFLPTYLLKGFSNCLRPTTLISYCVYGILFQELLDPAIFTHTNYLTFALLILFVFWGDACYLIALDPCSAFSWQRNTMALMLAAPLLIENRRSLYWWPLLYGCILAIPQIAVLRLFQGYAYPLVLPVAIDLIIKFLPQHFLLLMPNTITRYPPIKWIDKAYISRGLMKN